MVGGDKGETHELFFGWCREIYSTWTSRLSQSFLIEIIFLISSHCSIPSDGHTEFVVSSPEDMKVHISLPGISFQQNKTILHPLTY